MNSYPTTFRDAPTRETPVRWIAGLVLAVGFLVAVALPASTLGNFYTDLDELSDHVRNRSEAAARAKQDEISGFYERSRELGLDWFADSYLFTDSYLHQAAFSYLAQDYEAIVTDLRNKIDDPRASNLLGIAKFRLAQRRYRAIEGDHAAAFKARAEIVDEVLAQVNPDFERALRSEPDGSFEYKWNYDLTSDAAAIQRAFEIPVEIELPPLQETQRKGRPIRRRRG